MSATADALPPSQREAYGRAYASAGRLLAVALENLPAGSEGVSTAFVAGGPSTPEIAAASQRLHGKTAGTDAA